MVETYRTEEEQLEALKRWWSENGKSLVVGVLLAVAAIYGWRFWQSEQQQKGEAAAEVFFQLVEAGRLGVNGVGANRPDSDADEAAVATSTHLANTLKTDYAGSTYAVYAALMLAKAAVDKGDLKQAEQELSWAVEESDRNSELHTLATLRLARVVSAQGGQDNAERALALLEGDKTSAYASSYAELRGDIYLSLERVADARAAYQEAVDEAARLGLNKPLLSLKLDDVAGDYLASNSIEMDAADAVVEDDIEGVIENDTAEDTAAETVPETDSAENKDV